MPRARRTATRRRVFTAEQYDALGDPLVQRIFQPWASERAMVHAYLANATSIVSRWVHREPPYDDEAKAGPGTRPGIFWTLELELEELEAVGVLEENPFAGHGPRDGDALVSRQPYRGPALLDHLDAWLPGEPEAYRLEGSGERWRKLVSNHRDLAATGHHFALPTEIARP